MNMFTHTHMIQQPVMLADALERPKWMDMPLLVAETGPNALQLKEAADYEAKYVTLTILLTILSISTNDVTVSNTAYFVLTICCCN
jgi:hypothetical protein